jgi:hypothetical protein
MSNIFSKYIEKFYFKKWIIGIFRGDINKIIRSKVFDPDIKWLSTRSYNTFFADPFILGLKDDNLEILLEEFNFKTDHGKISLLKLDKSFKQVNRKVLLDTGSHLSYPFIFKDSNKTYIFPEAGKSGKFSCYEYDPINQSIKFVRDILDIPLLDATILKRDGKFWVIGSLGDNIKGYSLYIYFSNNLFGPYKAHPGNPVKSRLDGVRSAGSFIEVDGIIYRPAQNCANVYGESITIFKITELSEINFNEEFHMNIRINDSNSSNYGMHTIHTINAIDDIIMVDGIKWTFSPIIQTKNFLLRRMKAKL